MLYYWNQYASTCMYILSILFVSDSAFNTTDERGVYQQNYRDKTDYFDNPALVGEEQDKGNYNIRRIKHQQGASADRLGDNNDDEMNYSTIDGLSETL